MKPSNIYVAKGSLPRHTRRHYAIVAPAIYLPHSYRRHCKNSLRILQHFICASYLCLDSMSYILSKISVGPLKNVYILRPIAIQLK